ncbi:hypothetical protein BDB01DRAFT_774612 [Pilobolus umbonatus]|nr:hypothetical protein BDB01DRAFT_774612 [Pilobolus umbonatus]
MNKLSFRAFHEQHFGQEQTDYFKQFIKNSEYLYNQSQYFDQHPYPESNDDNQQEKDDEHNYVEQYDVNMEYSDEMEEENILSEEAIEIFRFSEAYREERDRARILEEEEEEKETEEWQYGESSVLHCRGIEAPSTTLVLKAKKEPLSEKIRIHEHILNSTYLASCDVTDSPVVLWPILPLRL